MKKYFTKTGFAYKIIPLSIGVALISATLCLTILAWTEPNDNPPNDNVKAPLNTGSATQTKEGGLIIGAPSWAQLHIHPAINDVYNPLTGSDNTAHFHLDFQNTPSGKTPLIEVPGNLWLMNSGGTSNLKVDGRILTDGELQSILSGSSAGQLRMVGGNYGAFLRNDGANTYFLLTNSGDQWGSWNSLRPLYINNVSGDVSVGTKLCLGGVCCSSWAECTGAGEDPFMPVSGCTNPLPVDPDHNKKIFVTSMTYNVELVHTPNFTYTMANADNICQTRAAAAGLSGTYLALMYETVLSQLNNCNLITVLRYPTDVLPAAALWNGQKIDGTNNCEWHLIAINGSDMFSVNTDGNYLQNPIKYNEFGTLTDARVFTNFKPTGNGAYDRMNTCLQNSTCDYITGGAIRGCFYGYSTSKDANWAGASSPLNGMGLCATPCMDAGSQKALYCVQQ